MTNRPSCLQLSVRTLKVGQSYQTDGGTGDVKHIKNTWAKIIQIVDDDSMLIAIGNGADENGGDRYPVLVMCKFPTKGSRTIRRVFWPTL